MEYKIAGNILLNLLNKNLLDDEEKEAVSTAIGIFSWVCLSESKNKVQKKARKEKLKKISKW